MQLPSRPLRSLFESLRLDLGITRRKPEVVAACLGRRLAAMGAPSDRPRVLFLAKPIFNDDVAALQQLGQRFEYLPLPSAAIRRIYYAFVSPQYHHNHTSYYEDDNEGERERYFHFLLAVLTILLDRHPCAAMLSSNYNYCWQQELARACVTLGVPFIVLHKEGINVCGHDADAVARYSNHRFVGHAVLTYNRHVARALAEAGIENLTDDRIVVVGVPRLDRYVRRPPEAGQDLAFFGFDLDATAGHLAAYRRGVTAIQERARQFSQFPLQFAERHATVPVVLKFKNTASHQRLIKMMLADYGRRVPVNVRIASGGDSESVVRRARAVASCSSTTLLEGLLARRTVIAPSFDDVVEGGLRDCFSDYPLAVHRATTLAEFEAATLQPSGSPAVPEPVVEELLFRADGLATERVERAIGRAIDRVA